IRKVALIPSPVLVVGESGTGKELVARAVHESASMMEKDPAGDRPGKDRPFVAVNSAAFPENLLESELFGHERGAFTGANRMHRGAFERASGGTLFLDEIGELPLPAQAKMLRVLEQRQVTRIGGEKTIDIDAKVIAATNRDLDVEVEAGRFRQDLYYRLNVHIVRVPPLRERLSDIPEIADLLLDTICARFGMRRKSISPEGLDILMAYTWPMNNVRELKNILERMVISGDGDILGPPDIPAEVRQAASGAGGAPAQGGGRGADPPRTFQQLKAEAERQIIVRALEANDYHISNTARELGLADHASLLKIMRRHNLKRK
ncbi:MAG TPA: sigma-54 dependent transcriptional regulator, partial [Candidatus Krumholzibacterium sp.]|nr:sigma-54 dependent transcriptional regulator [Candidatus Krumholzibacterium sp.]